MTDMELAYRKAEIKKLLKDKPHLPVHMGMTRCTAVDRANALEWSLIVDLWNTPGMTRDRAYEIVKKP